MMRFRWVAAYVGTAFMGLMMAMMVSSAFLSRVRAQAPTNSAPPSTDAALGAGATTTEPSVAGAPKTGAPTDEADAMAAAMAAAGAVPAETTPPPTTTAPIATSAPTVTKMPPKVTGSSADPNLQMPDAPAAAAPAQAPPAAKPAAPAQAQAPKTAAPPAAAPPMNAPAAGTSLGSEEYVYEGTGRRDPFRRYKAISTAGKTYVPSDLDPLLRYDLDQLTLLGILWDVRQPRALVKDSDGGVHTLVKNTKIGRNNGFVAAIREGEVIVIETFEEEGGASTKRSRVLELKK